MRKYFDTKKEAMKASSERRAQGMDVDVFRMQKGTRKAGKFAVCSYEEYLNTY